MANVRIGTFAELVWVVNVFTAAIINTPYFLLSNLYMSKPTQVCYYLKLLSVIS